MQREDEEKAALYKSRALWLTGGDLWVHLAVRESKTGSRKETYPREKWRYFRKAQWWWKCQYTLQATNLQSHKTWSRYWIWHRRTVLSGAAWILYRAYWAVAKGSGMSCIKRKAIRYLVCVCCWGVSLENKLQPNEAGAGDSHRLKPLDFLRIYNLTLLGASKSISCREQAWQLSTNTDAVC